MEPSSETYPIWPLYLRGAGAATAGALISAGCGWFAPLAYIPGGLLAATAMLLFWLAARPTISLYPSQMNIGRRAIAWQEVRAIRQAFGSPLILRIRLTNNRRSLIFYPGEPQQILTLVAHIRSRASRATFNGVPFDDYHVWSRLTDSEAEQLGLEEPAPMISNEDEQEIERLFQKLKSVGHLNPAVNEDPSPSGKRSSGEE